MNFVLEKLNFNTTVDVSFANINLILFLLFKFILKQIDYI